MILETKYIHVQPESELARLLDEAGEAPLVLERDGQRYRLIKETDIWAGYDPSRTRAALQKSTGALRGIDREKLRLDIHQARAQDSTGRSD
jgi:hypothetical protein